MLKVNKAQELPLRTLIIVLVIGIIILLLLLAFARQGLFNFQSIWKTNVFQNAGI